MRLMTLFNNGPYGNKRGLFKNIYGWLHVFGMRDTNYATKMTWKFREDRVEEVSIINVI